MGGGASSAASADGEGPKVKEEAHEKRRSMISQCSSLEQKLMAKFDVSKSGTLTRTEVENMGNEMLSSETEFNGKLSQADVDLVMRLGGEDCKPEITASELPTALSLLYHIKEDHQLAHDLFVKFDVDKSNGLPPDQLSNLLQELHFGIPPSPADVEYVLHQCGRTTSNVEPITEEELRPALVCWYMLMDHKAKQARKLNVVVIGARGAGKSTLGEAIEKDMGLVHVDSADLARESAKAGHDVGRDAQIALNKGQTLPEAVNSLVFKRLAEDDCKSKGWVLTGFPETADAARALADQLHHKPDAVVCLDLRPDLVNERNMGRLVDPLTGQIFHESLQLPATDEVLERCVARPEDADESSAANAYNTFNADLGQLEAFYRDVLVFVDASKKSDSVAHEVLQMLHEMRARLAHDAQEHTVVLTASPSRLGAAPFASEETKQGDAPAAALESTAATPAPPETAGTEPTAAQDADPGPDPVSSSAVPVVEASPPLQSEQVAPPTSDEQPH